MTDLSPIEKSVDVPLAPDAAFDLFTRDLALWWPVDTHSLSAYSDELPKSVTVEPREGGKILEEKQDGSLHSWGTITGWEPGARFAVDWHVGRPEEEATALEVRFLPHGNGSRVLLTHGGWSALGKTAADIRGNYLPGWDLVLGDCFGGLCHEQVRLAAE